jgi:hypothetical protein
MTTQEDIENEELLKLFGLVVINAQALECQLVSLFAATELAHVGEAPSVSIRELMDTRLEQTLGRLIRDAVRDLALDTSLSELLSEALSERNWLVHRFYWEFAPSAFDSRLRQQAMDRLRKGRQLLERTSEVVHDEVIRRYSSASGYSREQIEERSQIAMERYINGKA